MYSLSKCIYLYTVSHPNRMLSPGSLPETCVTAALCTQNLRQNCHTVTSQCVFVRELVILSSLTFFSLKIGSDTL